MPSASQSSQQSFSMSQQSQGGRNSASFHRGFAVGGEGPQIYSVRLSLSHFRSSSYRLANPSPA